MIVFFVISYVLCNRSLQSHKKLAPFQPQHILAYPHRTTERKQKQLDTVELLRRAHYTKETERFLIINYDCRYDSNYSCVMSARYLLAATVLFWTAAFLICVVSIPSVATILAP